MFSSADAQVVPYDLLGENAELACRHFGVRFGFPLLHQLPGVLRGPLRVEFQEDSADEISLALPVFVLLRLNLGNELGQMLTSIGDGVDLFTNQELEAMGGAVLRVAKVVHTLSCFESLLSLLRLDAILVGIAGELDLAVLELHCGGVPIIDQLLQILAVGGDPGVLDARKHLEQGGLGDGLGYVGEQDGLGGKATSPPGGASVGHLEVHSEEALAGDDDHDHQQEDDRNQSVGIVAIHVGDVAHGEQVELLLAGAAGSIDGEEDGPGDEAAKEADDDEQLEEADKQVAVNGLVVQNVLVLDVAEVGDPAEESIARGGRLAVVAQAVDVGARGIEATEATTEDEE